MSEKKVLAGKWPGPNMAGSGSRKPALRWGKGGIGFFVVAFAALIAFAVLPSTNSGPPAEAQDTTKPKVSKVLWAGDVYGDVDRFGNERTVFDDYVAVVFDEDLDDSSVPDASAFSIRVEFAGRTGPGEPGPSDRSGPPESVRIGLSGITLSDPRTMTNILFLESSTAFDPDPDFFTVSVSYTAPTTGNKLQDEAGNEVDSFGPHTAPLDLQVTSVPTPTPTPTPIPDSTLVSNIGTVRNLNTPLRAGYAAREGFEDANVDGKWRHLAIAFTTGRNGAMLTEVDLDFHTAAPLPPDAEPQISIYTTDSSGVPQSSLMVLNNPNLIEWDGINTFTAPAGSRELLPNTTYAIVIESINFTTFNPSNVVRLARTASIDEDAGGERGWSIADVRYYRDNERSDDGDDTNDVVFTPWMLACEFDPDPADLYDELLDGRDSHEWCLHDPDYPPIDEILGAGTPTPGPGTPTPQLRPSYSSSLDNAYGLPRIALRGRVGSATGPAPTPTPVPIGESFLRASSCDGKLFLTWNAPRHDIDGFLIQWKSGEEEFDLFARNYRKSDPDASSFTLQNLTNDIPYRVRILGYRGSDIDVWSEDVDATPSATACISGVSYGAILADSAPAIVHLEGAPAGTMVNMQYRSANQGRWSDVRTEVLAEGETSVTFDLTLLRSGTWYEVRIWIKDGSVDSGIQLLFQTAALPPGARDSGGGASRIVRIEPSVSSVTLSAGDTVTLSVEAYGRQGLHQNGLLDKAPADGRPALVWHSDDGTFAEADIRQEWRNGQPDDRRVVFTAPDRPGTTRVTVSFANDFHCLIAGEDESDEDRMKRCTAVIDVSVRRTSATQPPEEAPANPPGDIPGVLSDADGNQYEVFTPVEGGTFSGEGYSITAPPGAVPNGEYIGIRMSDDGAASNVGETHQRYTLGGSRYAISAIDGSQQVISSYVLDGPATVCLPLPAELRTNISDLAIVALNGEGSLTVLSTRVRIGDAGTMVCGSLSSLPASVAVGHFGAPEAIPTPTPVPTPETPDTGGTSPASGAIILWALMLGIAVLALGSALAIGRRRSTN